jgi:hypothetical protein
MRFGEYAPGRTVSTMADGGIEEVRQIGILGSDTRQRISGRMRIKAHAAIGLLISPSRSCRHRSLQRFLKHTLFILLGRNEDGQRQTGDPDAMDRAPLRWLMLSAAAWRAVLAAPEETFFRDASYSEQESTIGTRT